MPSRIQGQIEIENEIHQSNEKKRYGELTNRISQLASLFSDAGASDIEGDDCPF